VICLYKNEKEVSTFTQGFEPIVGFLKPLVLGFKLLNPLLESFLILLKS
jgi:hypothetical protein